MGDFWLYRVGLYVVDSHSRRALFSETWLSEDPEIMDPAFGITLQLIAVLMRTPFGNHASLMYTNYLPFYERIYPQQALFTNFTAATPAGSPPLNPNAPEAAFRLRRVGASGTSQIGRICYPILDDTFYTDLPHRRHVDVATLSTYLSAAADPLRFTRVPSGGRVYKQVIFNRRQLTWTPVTHYELMSNPVRIWQRWRGYDIPDRVAQDVHYQPPEHDKLAG
jgi:hypothetical protein